MNLFFGYKQRDAYVSKYPHTTLNRLQLAALIDINNAIIYSIIHLESCLKFSQAFQDCMMKLRECASGYKVHNSIISQHHLERPSPQQAG